MSRLRSLLIEFYPNAVAAFPVLTHKAALAVLGAAPTPTAASKLTRSKLVTLLRRSGRGDQPGLADTILAHLHTPALGQPALVEAGFGRAVAALLPVISAMQAGIAKLETAMTAQFTGHDAAALLRAAPGLGPILAARVVAEVGDDPTRFETAQALRSFAGTVSTPGQN